MLALGFLGSFWENMGVLGWIFGNFGRCCKVGDQVQWGRDLLVWGWFQVFGIFQEMLKTRDFGKIVGFQENAGGVGFFGKAAGVILGTD